MVCWEERSAGNPVIGKPIESRVCGPGGQGRGGHWAVESVYVRDKDRRETDN